MHEGPLYDVGAVNVWAARRSWRYSTGRSARAEPLARPGGASVATPRRPCVHRPISPITTAYNDVRALIVAIEELGLSTNVSSVSLGFHPEI